MSDDEYDKLRRQYNACMAMAADRSTTKFERATAKAKAKQIAAKLRTMGRNVPIDDVKDDNDYKLYVERGLQAKANIDASQWALGACAANIVIQDGAMKLQQYAKDIDVVYTTLRHYRATYRAWRRAPGGYPTSFAVATALNTHPDRYQILTNNPNLTELEARDLMRKYRGTKSKPARQSKIEIEIDSHRRRRHQ